MQWIGRGSRAAPSVYPAGTTIYEPEAPHNGYTVLAILGTPAVIVIDMNGPSEGRGASNAVYRAYRIPYGWLPQVLVPGSVQ